MNVKQVIPSDQINAIIGTRLAATDEVLREIERNFITSTKGHITYHKKLMELAEKSGDMRSYLHHRVMMETYETLLRNYEASSRYVST